MKVGVFLFLLSSIMVNGQKNPYFEQEVLALTKKYDSIWDATSETVVFTGSSSIKMWHDLKQLYPNQQIVNTGFGGSQAIDLLGYTEELILKYQPTKVFIYEGDNDISAKKKPREILNTFKDIISKIQDKNKETQIVIISTKPSIARYHLRRKFKRLNRKLVRLCKRDPGVQFANVWDSMYERNKLKKKVFLSDGLHMNHKGYQLWHQVIKEYMN